LSSIHNTSRHKSIDYENDDWRPFSNERPSGYKSILLNNNLSLGYRTLHLGT